MQSNQRATTGAVSADAGDAIDVTETRGLGGARLSATVILMRDAPDGPEVWMQERVLSMPNYPGITVFPGGGVDTRDFPGRSWDDGELWTGRSGVALARQLGLTKYKAHAVMFAAVRELFEETGIFLVVDHYGNLLDDASIYHEHRLALESHSLSLTDVLQHNDLVVSGDLLLPYGRWVGKSERGTWFDTFSFLAAHPEGQEPDGNTGEADDANWFPPGLLIEGWRHGLVRFAPSTWMQLVELAAHDTVADALKAARDRTITPIVGDPVDDERMEEYFHRAPKDRIGRHL
ncbi:NUDIX domain-containing protein [Corynebacterium sp. TA-R-1]|uniref:NUDIX domain-containing protein n=1 Tax=Corynebacterium stercoris TaxID=2943490 RepID=A0ABT1G2M1_9CORY|nr:NUDIX domain-containing protein [Corynebacterium stercoris]